MSVWHNISVLVKRTPKESFLDRARLVAEIRKASEEIVRRIEQNPENTGDIRVRVLCERTDV